MSAESCHDRINSKNEKKKSEFLISNEIPETELNEDIPALKTAADNSFKLVDHKEENLCNWMNSGFYLFASQDSQENRNKAAGLAHPRRMAQMTVQNYMRSLHQFSEMPVLSRWNSASSSHSLPSAPKSVAEWLDFSEKDPVEILLDLGFGTDEPDICTKIPSRFISCVSTAKGINIRVFIEAQRQRLDLENPNLCGRFRQLQVLDHVTSAFSSLLNDISTVQQKSEECLGEGYSADNSKGKTVITQAKRRRIGQLLRKVSRQKSLHGPQTYRSAGKCQDTEHYTYTAGVDLCLASKAALPEGASLVSVQEELDPSEEEAIAVTQPALLSFSKARVLPHLLKKQSQLPCTSQMPTKDKSHKESNLLWPHMFKRYSLNCKPSDSFEMEEIQSFEDEYFWGNPPESTSDMIVMRTNSCQSDSSGFLEDAPDPLPLQGLSVSGNLRFSSNSHDCQPFLRHKKDSSLTSQDLLLNAEGPVASTAIADGGNVLLLSSLSREHNFPGEEIFYSINEEEDPYETLGDKCEKAAKGTAHEMSKTRMKGQREELEEEETGVQDWLSCCHVDDGNRASISHPEKRCSHYVSEKHQREDSASVQESCKMSRSQIHEERKECEEPLTEQEEVTDVCREDVLEGVNECVDERFYNKKSCRNSPNQITEVSSNDQDAKQEATTEPLTIPEESQTEPGIPVVQSERSSRKLLQDSSLSPYSLEKEGISSVDTLSASTQLDQGRHIPSFETNASFKSVTVQMPSRLMSSQRTLSLGETHVKNLSLYLNSNMPPCSNETLTAAIQQASKEIDNHKREVSIQTEDQKKKESFPCLHSLPTFHWHGHLLKSASLDTGLYGKYRTHCHEPSHDWCAPHPGHCCALKSHNRCLLWSFLSTHSCRHAVTCCSSHATTELQLLKTLRLLQDTAVRNISSCTVHEIDVMKNSCQKFREQLDEIEQHLMEQEALFSTAMSNEGREERRHLQILRQAVRREVAELEYQLQDRARQVKEGLLMHLDQLLGEQSNLCSELGIPERREEREAQNEPTLPDTDAVVLSRPGCSKKICHRLPGRSATVPSSPSDSVPRDKELGATALAATKANSTSDPKELHTSKKEAKGLSQSKIDFKAFIQSLKKSFRSSFSNETPEERN